jgi:hypothetical protein
MQLLGMASTWSISLPFYHILTNLPLYSHKKPQKLIKNLEINASGILQNIYKYTKPLVKQTIFTEFYIMTFYRDVYDNTKIMWHQHEFRVQTYHTIYQLYRTPHVYCGSKTGNLSIAENLGCVSVGYSEDRNLETAVTVAQCRWVMLNSVFEAGWYYVMHFKSFNQQNCLPL